MNSQTCLNDAARFSKSSRPTRLPDGWDQKHFNAGRLEAIADRVFFPYTRQMGYADTDPEVQDLLKRVWVWYAYIKRRERVVRNPGGLIWKLMRMASQRIEPKKQDAPKLFEEVFGGR
jgi:hypothetical protein